MSCVYSVYGYRLFYVHRAWGVVGGRDGTVHHWRTEMGRRARRTKFEGAVSTGVKGAATARREREDEMGKIQNETMHS